MEPYKNKDGYGNGFLFEILDRIGFEYAVSEAIKFYNLPDDVKYRNIKRIMKESPEKFSMQKTAEKYMEIYDRLIAEQKK